MDWNQLAENALAGRALSKSEGLAILESPDSEILALMQAAFQVRQERAGNIVRVHVLKNAKSDACPEDCSFCSQSFQFQTEVPRYQMESVEDLVAGAQEAVEKGAVTYCMVTATRGPSSEQVERVCEAVKQIKEKWPISVCLSLGLLADGQAETLAAAGVDRYNHNLETSESHFAEVCSTHTWRDRVATIESARAAGMEACCGGIFGMGEDMNDRVDLALSLNELGVESIPLNFLDPRPGTPLGEAVRLKPHDALRGLALMRLANPKARDIRMAGGREAALGSMQPLALYAANSLFSDGYLTTGGQSASADAKMIEEAGFVAEVISE